MMPPLGFVILIAVGLFTGIFLMGYAAGSITEHRKSQWEIDVLTKVIEGCCKEDKVNVS